MTTTKFTGAITALLTPFQDGRVAWDDLQNLIDFQIREGIKGLAAVGTTGESPTLDTGEHLEVIRYAVAQSAGKVPVIAGTGSNATSEAVSLSKSAAEAGVDGLLVVAPYYNKPSPEGLFRYFSEIAEQTDKPIILYSIPSRCGIEIDLDTLIRLRERYPHISHIKEAGGTCGRVDAIRAALGDSMTILSGDDGLTLPFLSIGAEGVISVASNIIPQSMVQLTQAAAANDFTAARALHERFYPLFQALFSESNPVPVKAAAHRMQLIGSPEVRSPLSPLQEETARALEAVLHDLELLPS